MSQSRPQSWYGVQQPYSRQAPGHQAPLLPGAPDFPPASAAAPAPSPSPSITSTQQASYTHRSSQSLSQPSNSAYASEIQRSPSPRRYSQGAPVTSVPAPQNYQSTQPTWRPGHHSSHSQPAVFHFTQEPDSYANLNSPDTAAGRPVSPRPMLPTPTSQYSDTMASTVPYIPRVHSPQPRRSTLPSPILSSPSTTWQQPAPNPQPFQHTTQQPTQPPYVSAIPRVPAGGTVSRRALPTPPGGPRAAVSASPSPIPITSPALPSTLPHSSATSVSPALSRSSSVASNASASSTGSIRRPLPRPPLPVVPGAPSPQSTTRQSPASHGHAQADVATLPAAPTAPSESVPSTPVVAVSDAGTTEPYPTRSLRERMQEMSTRARQTSDSAAKNKNNAPPKQAVPNIQIPLPSFSFDGVENVHDDDVVDKGIGPSISISVAPPSPSLSKATSDDYFEPSLPDEGIPLPSCSVPMATSTNTKAYALACPACNKPVLYGRTVNAMGKRWHPDCFQCSHCALKLEHFEFFTKDGKPYCHVDYHELFSIRCSHCKTPIVDESYITIDDAAMGGKKTFHELHFFCSNCGDPFIDPKARGIANSHANGEGEEDGSYAKPFTVHNGFAYCENCNLKLHKTKCSKCTKPIQGDVLRALNKNWCDDCFVCDVCQRPFDDGTFLVWESKPHCEECYKIRLRSEV